MEHVRSRLVCGALIACALITCPWRTAAEDAETVPTIIAHASSGTSTLSPWEIRDVFLGVMRAWPDGTPIRPVLLEGGPLHTAFLELHVGKSDQQFRRYWRQMVFAGTGTAPRAFPDQGLMLAYIARTPGAIGYAAESVIAQDSTPDIAIIRVRREEER